MHGYNLYGSYDRKPKRFEWALLPLWAMAAISVASIVLRLSGYFDK